MARPKGSKNRIGPLTEDELIAWKARKAEIARDFRKRLERPKALPITNCPHVDELHYSLGLCQRCYNQKRSSRTTAAKIRRKELQANPTYVASRLKYNLRKFGLAVSTYDSMLTAQNNNCAICKGPPCGGKRLAVDHCHETKQIRGLLCSRCNTALGQFRDSENLLKEAINYLKYWNSLKEDS